MRAYSCWRLDETEAQRDYSAIDGALPAMTLERTDVRQLELITT
jgi:hypothetical protein